MAEGGKSCLHPARSSWRPAGRILQRPVQSGTDRGEGSPGAAWRAKSGFPGLLEAPYKRGVCGGLAAKTWQAARDEESERVGAIVLNPCTNY